MLFLIVAPMCLLILRLQTRWRWRTIIWTAIVLGLTADFGTDWLIAIRH